jgi:glycosyltransferase involved in cell wall biosynthesis
MKSKPRICINGITENSEIRGPVRYIYELAAHLDTSRFEVILIASDWQRTVYGPLEQRISIHYVPISRGRVRRAWFFFWSMPRLLRSMRIDVYHIPDTNPLPILRGRTRVVSTIHDSAEYLAPFRFSWYQAAYRRVISKLQAHGSDAVITVSESSKRDLVKYLRVAPEVITVTHLGVTPLTEQLAAVPIADNGNPTTQYILYVGVIENVKNVDRLVEAYALLAPDLRQTVSLYLVGRKSNAFAKVTELIRQHGIGGQVRIFGYISEDELHQLYRGASIVAYLSEYEGFGLPILEAMRFGIPVLASNRSSIPEVAGTAALLVDTDIANITRGLDTLLRDSTLREELATRGLQRAATFRWEWTARATERVYDQVVSLHLNRA